MAEKPRLLATLDSNRLPKGPLAAGRASSGLARGTRGPWGAAGQRCDEARETRQPARTRAQAGRRATRPDVALVHGVHAGPPAPRPRGDTRL